MKIFVVGASQGEYSDRTDWNICAFHTEGEAEACVNKLVTLQKFNEEFYKSLRSQKDEVESIHRSPISPPYPEPSSTFRHLQQALVNGNGTPDQKVAFKKAQNEHLQNIDLYRKKVEEWEKTQKQVYEQQDLAMQTWFDLNYNPPAELAEVRKYMDFSSKVSYYRDFDVYYSYEELELHE